MELKKIYEEITHIANKFLDLKSLKNFTGSFFDIEKDLKAMQKVLMNITKDEPLDELTIREMIARNARILGLVQSFMAFVELEKIQSFMGGVVEAVKNEKISSMMLASQTVAQVAARRHFEKSEMPKD